MIDGARNAILGYLYQLWLTATLRAYPAGTQEVPERWRTLVGRVARGSLTAELFNQDLLVRSISAGPTECAAVQVKHSGDQSELITPQDFVEILYGFERSTGLAAADGWQVDKYFVITNRDRDPDVETVWVNRSRTELEQLLRKRTRGGTWLTKLHEKYQSEQEAISAWTTVLRNLEPPLTVSYDAGMAALRSFAIRHGVLPTELEGALDKLLGRLFQDSFGAVPLEVTEEWLKLQLTGAPDVLNASFGTTDGILAVARQRLQEWLSDVAGPVHTALTRRRLARTLADNVARYSLTFVCGDGGSGKSVLAVQHLLATDTGPAGLTIRASDVSEQFLLLRLRQLRSPLHHGKLTVDSLDHAVSRLKEANPGRTVVLAFHFDALDEAVGSNKGELRELIRRLWEDGENGGGARLLVSYRRRSHDHREKENLIREWLGVDYPERFLQRIGFVDVNDFDTEELAEAARNLNGAAEERILRSPEMAAIEHTKTLEDPGDGDSPSQTVLDSLRHPVVWGSYAALQPHERNLVLDGSPVGTDRLTEHLMGRFLHKCRVRRSNLGHESNFEMALRKIARASSTADPHYTDQLWQTACRGVLNDGDAGFLYSEALTYGLIQEDAPLTWRWRHQFVADSLSRGGS